MRFVNFSATKKLSKKSLLLKLPELAKNCRESEFSIVHRDSCEFYYYFVYFSVSSQGVRNSWPITSVVKSFAHVLNLHQLYISLFSFAPSARCRQH
jgi:hypothetical protein